jgi:exoribonuclease R
MSDQQKGVEIPQSEAAPTLTTTPLTGAQRQARHKEKRKQQKLAENYKFNSDTEPTKAEAYEILEEVRSIRHPHILNTVYKRTLEAAEQDGLPANRFRFAKRQHPDRPLI